ncbi:MAG: acylphosphatase [Gemmatimonadota bacterium]|nr:acylphosphatase [Gemmatimonadota bacterium]
MPANLYRERMVLSGRVQGVGFRFFTCRVAEKYPVTGYVKNLPGGEVEVVAEGEQPSVEAFLREVAQGPGYSLIKGVKSLVEPATGSFQAFGVRS